MSNIHNNMDNHHSQQESLIDFHISRLNTFWSSHKSSHWIVAIIIMIKNKLFCAEFRMAIQQFSKHWMVTVWKIYLILLSREIIPVLVAQKHLVRSFYWYLSFLWYYLVNIFLLWKTILNYLSLYHDAQLYKIKLAIHFVQF